MNEDFRKLLIRLKEHHVAFVVIGGYAAVAHGCTNVTQDLDVCLQFVQENLSRLYQSIQDLNPVHRMTPNRIPFVFDETKSNPYKNLYLDTEWGILDCLGEVKGIGDFDRIVKQTSKIRLNNAEIDVLDIPALIQAKKAMNRKHDLETIEQLKAIEHLRKSNRLR